jgi:hypothetical protein
MNKELDSIKRNLSKYDYKYKEYDDRIEVNIKYSLNVIIEFDNKGKIIVKNTLVPWNFLTGIIKMSATKAILYNFIFMILFAIYSLRFNLNEIPININILHATIIGWILIWNIYYISKIIELKIAIMIWTKNIER